MPSEQFNFTTGQSTLPDVGVLSYNGVTFSPLFETRLSGRVIQDDARRATKLVEYSLEVDGYVTLGSEALRTGGAPPATANISSTMYTLASRLTAHGGELMYIGRGFDLHVNPPGRLEFAGIGLVAGAVVCRDVAWGPVPELLDFQPLGGGRSAKVKWRVTVRTSILPVGTPFPSNRNAPLLQFNIETSLMYPEDGYSTLNINGTMEVPLTRPTQGDRSLAYTVDSFRSEIQARVLNAIDLDRFRIVDRSFNISRDKRTLQFAIHAEEKPYMDLPPFVILARGSYGVRPSKTGMGLANWLCTLRVTYTIPKHLPRRVAWWAFLCLLRKRMNFSTFSNVPPPASANGQNPVVQVLSLPVTSLGAIVTAAQTATFFYETLIRSTTSSPTEKPRFNAWLIDFSIDEGLYLDSKITSFSATWRLVTSFSHILLASGLWRKLPETDNAGKGLWAISLRNISGVQSWLPNTLDPAQDVIVDFGGG